MSKILGVGSILLAVALLAGLVITWALPNRAEAAPGGWQSGARGGGRSAVSPGARGTGYVAPGDLSDAEAKALLMALDDEYKAWAVYDQVIDDLGSVQPFTSIQRSEESHIAALKKLLERYGLDVPANNWTGTFSSFDTLAQACAAGVEAEVDNAALYDKLFSMVDNADIVRVFTRLQSASENNHLPAFELCAQ